MNFFSDRMLEESVLHIRLHISQERLYGPTVTKTEPPYFRTCISLDGEKVRSPSKC